MPPVALGETDPRRWGADSAAGEDAAVVVGGPRWPRAGLANNPSALDSAAFSIEKTLPPPPHLSGSTYASSGRIDAGAAAEARAFIDDLQQHGGGGDLDGRASPGLPRAPRPTMMMDPRIDTHAGGASVAGGGGGGGGGQQGSHFSPASPFDHHHAHQQPRHAGHPHVRPGDEAGLAPFRVSAARVHGTSAASSAGQSMQQPRGSGGGPPPAAGGGPPPQLRQQQQQQQPPPPPPQQQQHRSPFEYGALMPGEQQQQQQQHQQHQQQPLGRALGMALGPGMSRGRNLGGNMGSYQDQQQQQGQQQQQQQQQQPLRGSSPGGSRSISRGSPPTIGSNINGGILSAQQQPHQRGTASPDRHHPHHSSMSMAALASVPHGASTLPASAVPTVLERFPGFVRCVMDIAPEVVGWVIGRSGAHIKEMKHRSGCGMWVDQKDLKLYITGADMPRIHAAAALVGDLISKAPVNVNSAGVEDEVTSHMIECPPHLIGLLIGRGGSTIKRIKEESRANVVINQKMMKVIVSGIPQSVRLGVAMIEDVITFGRSAEHGAGLTAMGGAFPPNFLDFPGGIADMADFMEDGGVGAGLDRFTLRAAGPPGQPLPPLDGVGAARHGSPSLSLPGVGGGSVGGGMSSSLSSAGGEAFSRLSGGSPYEGGATRQQQQQQQQQHHELAAGGGGGGRPAKMESMMSNLDMDMMSAAGYDGKEMDWSVFSASSSMFNIGGGGGAEQPQRQQQSPSIGHHQSSPGGGSGGGGGGRGRPPLDSPRRHHHHHHPGGDVSGHPHHQDMHHLSGLPPPASSSSSSVRILGSKDISGGATSDSAGSGAALVDGNSAAHSHGSRSSSLAGGPGGLPGFNNSAASGSRTGSVSSGGTPPLAGRSMPMSAPWNIMGPPPLRGVDIAAGRVGGLGSSSSSPGGEVVSAAAGGAALLNMNRLSINSDEDSNSGGRSLGQANRERERSGTPVGNPADLAEFLGVMGLGQYAQALTENEIDLEAVQLMADSDFQDVGIPKGPRVKLLYALRTKRYPPRSGDISAMKTFLISLGLERYCKVFEESEVDMGAVDVMEESDYAQLGVAKGPRLKMMNVLARPTTGSGNASRSNNFANAPKGGGGSNKAGSSMSILSPDRLLLSPRTNSGGSGSGGQAPPSSTLSPSQWSVRGTGSVRSAAAGAGAIDDDVDSVVGGALSGSPASRAASSTSSPAREQALKAEVATEDLVGVGSSGGGGGSGSPHETDARVNAAASALSTERAQQQQEESAQAGEFASQEQQQN